MRSKAGDIDPAVVWNRKTPSLHAVSGGNGFAVGVNSVTMDHSPSMKGLFHC